jgi:hypothetical protein
MMQVEQRVGRLAEVRYRAPLTLDELSEFMVRVRGLVEKATSPLVFCCDWREIESFDGTFVDTLVWTMRRDNARVAANGVLVSASNTPLFEQVSAIVREARSPKRRVFRTRRELVTFLHPLLDGAERRRRDEFLDETRSLSEPPMPAAEAASGSFPTHAKGIKGGTR